MNDVMKPYTTSCTNKVKIYNWVKSVDTQIMESNFSQPESKQLELYSHNREIIYT